MPFRLFDWLTKRDSRTPWIKESDFVKKLDAGSENTENPREMILTQNTTDMQDSTEPNQGRELIDEFLRRDFEPDGYQDALVDSDASYADANKKILHYKLELIINRALTYYTDKIKDYDFHIKTRKENGMLDTAEEVESEKGKTLEEINKIEAILNDAKENRGIGYMSILSRSEERRVGK